MKRNIIIFLGLIISVFLLKSCFVDDGNYDYKDIEKNKIDIEFKTYTLNLYPGEPVEFTPTLHYHNKEQTDTNIYKWEYHFDNYGLVCKERNMSMVFDDAKINLQHDGIVIVTDTTTGGIYTSLISFRYVSPHNLGWLVLSNDNGKSTLNFARELNGEWFGDDAIYKATYKKELGTNPVKVYVDRMMRNEVRIIQDESIILDAITYENLGNFESEFIGKKYPEGFKPKYMRTTGGGLSAMLGENGEVYTKNVQNSTDYPFQSFVDVPVQLNGQALDVQYLLLSTRSSFGMVLYDKMSSSFYLLEGIGYYDTGGLHQLKPPVNWSPSLGSPSPADLSKYEVVDCQAQNAAGYVIDIFSILKEKSTGAFYTYSFGYTASKTNVIVTNIGFKQIPSPAAALMGDNAKRHILRKRPYLFFAPESEPTKLYYYDSRTSMHTLFKGDFDSPITSIESNYDTDNTIGVGLENGKFYLLNISEEILTGVEPDDDIVDFEKQFNGKIVDIYYKQKS